MPITAERGYLIPAFGSVYQRCAEQLKSSILTFHPDANITILTEEQLPYGDKGGYANDWQVYAASPYRETIKLEADMIAASPVDHWWRLFENRDVVISRGCRNIYNEPGTSRHYRKIFDNNNLPDVYNAITYWRKSRTAQYFFDTVRQIFENWNDYKTLLKFPDELPTTDVVYGVAAVIMGEENVTLPEGYGPTIVHMKKHMIGALGEDWRDEFVWENTKPGLRLDTVAQFGFVHYYQKEWVYE